MATKLSASQVSRNKSYPVIALMGAAMAGKTTLGDILAHVGFLRGRDVERFSFAEPLKDLAQACFLISRYSQKSHLTDVVPSPWGGVEYCGSSAHDADRLTVRAVLQRLGMAIRESVPGIFTNRLLVEMNQCPHRKNLGMFVIDDVRFEDEVEAVTVYGSPGVIVGVVRPGGPELEEASERAHASEDLQRRMDEYADIIIVNDSPKETYGEDLRAVSHEIIRIVAARGGEEAVSRFVQANGRRFSAKLTGIANRNGRPKLIPFDTDD
jgi:hypothetical protein